METLKEIKKKLETIDISSNKGVEESILKLKEFLGLVKTLRVEMEGTLSNLSQNIQTSQETLLQTEKRRDEVAAEYDKLTKSQKESLARFNDEVEEKKKFSDDLDVKITNSSKIVENLMLERSNIVESISGTQLQIGKIHADIKSLEREKSIMQERVDALASEYAELEKKKDELTKDLNTKKSDAAILEKRLKELKKN